MLRAPLEHLKRAGYQPVRFVTLIYAYLRMPIGAGKIKACSAPPEKIPFAWLNGGGVVGRPVEFALVGLIGLFGFWNGLGKCGFPGENVKKFGLVGFYRFIWRRPKANGGPVVAAGLRMCYL